MRPRNRLIDCRGPNGMTAVQSRRFDLVRFVVDQSPPLSTPICARVIRRDVLIVFMNGSAIGLDLKAFSLLSWCIDQRPSMIVPLILTIVRIESRAECIVSQRAISDINHVC
jgi:hypothetical protein